MISAKNQWTQDITTLNNLRRGWFDVLSVVEGSLNLKEGEFYFESDKIIILKPENIADYLEKLIKNIGKECFESLQSSENKSLSFYEEVADFKREVKCLYSCISMLQYAIRDIDKNQAERYSELFKLASTFLDEVKKHKSTLKQPPLSERPIKHIEYNERTDFRSIEYFPSQRVPLKEIVDAAKKALLLARPPSKPLPLYMKCITVVIGLLMMIYMMSMLGLFTVIKIILWNPIEWFIRGEVRTLSPLRLYLRSVKEKEDHKNRHMRAYQLFVPQLLRYPVITDEVAKAFIELAPNAKSLDLHRAILASEDITELAPFIKKDTREGSIPIEKYLNTIKSLCEKKNITLQTLDAVSHLYELDNKVYLKPNRERKENESIESFLEEMVGKMKGKGDYIKPYVGSPYINPKALLDLLNASSSASQDISLSKDLTELPIVADFLKQHSYRLKEEDSFEKTYQKFSWI
jgi:hypothetical protein